MWTLNISFSEGEDTDKQNEIKILEFENNTKRLTNIMTKNTYIPFFQICSYIFFVGMRDRYITMM